ncbi:hypothetical protein AAMO2058_000127200 [Amorphochlora amoebiformis]|uniref:Glutaredoxin domain-containing protein n=1 Tax=Amorphochlora amoebiformis TaxID=1561963 RepID=A0A7S0DPR8_9EUKA|mmetsp:Transcript_5164/g.7813  ORF Transcript_5164/g.7813 Transcript_5164/m.7813 type:complete len:169 (+) Transcript_5164:49-555(+)
MRVMRGVVRGVVRGIGSTSLRPIAPQLMRALPSLNSSPLRSFSFETHDDFKPQPKQQLELQDIHQLIQQDVKENPLMVYMKGTPNAPQCGFSNQVVQILKHMGYDFRARNVLQDNMLREGVKQFSDWPTIPQVYVDGEFVGGCDIIMEMYKTGELEDLLEGSKAEKIA